LKALADTRRVSNVTAGAADLNGFLSYTGFAATAVNVYWGLRDGGTDAAAWDATNAFASPQVPGPLSVHVSGLDTNRLYFYRFATDNGFGLHWAQTTEIFAAGAVTLQAADAIGQETPVNSGTVLLHRPPGATNAALPVYYEFGGSAQNGEDYSPLPTSAIFQAGSTTVTLTITPLRDSLIEGQETATVTLLSGPYELGHPSLVTVFIEDSPAAGVDLIWDNAQADRNWNDSSFNWIPGSVNFLAGDNVTFSGISTGCVYVGNATYTSPGFSASAPVSVSPRTIKVLGGIYELEGGHVASGTTLITGGARLVDRNLDFDSFGDDTITLDGGEFWRQIGAGRTSHLTNDIAVESASLLNGNVGSTYWDGSLELKDTLTLNYSRRESTSHDHWFTGEIILNQDTNYPNAREIDVHGRFGRTYLTGNIMSDTNLLPGAGFPLVLRSRRFKDTVLAGEIYVMGQSNAYNSGTIIAYGPTQGNHELGVTVGVGSQLGTGPVTVQGSGLFFPGGAILTLDSQDAIHDDATLTLQDYGKVVLPGTNQLEVVQGLIIDGVASGEGTYGKSDYPDNIDGPGKIRVYVYRQLDALFLVIR
jgi:hypothetical protein